MAVGEPEQYTETSDGPYGNQPGSYDVQRNERSQDRGGVAAGAPQQHTEASKTGSSGKAHDDGRAHDDKVSNYTWEIQLRSGQRGRLPTANGPSGNRTHCKISA